MTGRIVLLGATGFTGRLTAERMVRRGLRPLLVARDPARLAPLAERLGELGELETRRADVTEPGALKSVLGPGDVLVSTVGPFVRLGHAAVTAAIEAGAWYFDSCGEAPFIREVFERYGAAAERAGVGLVPGFGYDYVPGNLAGALALEAAGPAAVRVDTGYFVTGGTPGPALMTPGTAASLVGCLLEPGFTWRDGELRADPAGARTRRFPLPTGRSLAMSLGGSEHLALPRSYPRLREVNVYLGWFGETTRLLSLTAAAFPALARVPGVKPAFARLSRRLAGSSIGPDPIAVDTIRSHVVGLALDESGAVLAESHLRGPNGYPITGSLLTWASERAADGGLRATGALGPIEAFGLAELRSAAALAGLVEWVREPRDSR
ncbi:saccharopine dehydrogenase family protein [Amycolatopsis nigrescens]|uniref:saccharopine dehydrogenase family protein n=1 Tax=Amycolatopsis nigrescens TaxID=381445 RepID=UPI00037DCEE2|nr:saccharopine dehydrogenase NADP-binding domain-containing protein [Amycolatopsis nigrescens]